MNPPYPPIGDSDLRLVVDRWSSLPKSKRRAVVRQVLETPIPESGRADVKRESFPAARQSPSPSRLVETRSGMRMFLRSCRERWPMDPQTVAAEIARLREIADDETRGRVSWRAREALAELADMGIGVTEPA